MAGRELRGAVDEWQRKRSSPGPLLTTGFLDGVRPVVDVYELKVRLEHMLQRLRVLAVARASARPLRLLPGLYLGDAVAASSAHTLRHLGVTHVVNATEDLLPPDEALRVRFLRCPLRDVEEEDVLPHCATAADFIDAALAGGGTVLVHCHAGRSRSCSLVRGRGGVGRPMCTAPRGRRCGAGGLCVTCTRLWFSFSSQA